MYPFIYLHTRSVGCVWIWFGGKNDDYVTYEIYGIATVLGISMSAMAITGLSLVSCLIGDNIGNTLS